MANQVLGDVQWDAMLKELYPDGVPLEIMQRGHAFMSLVQKDGNTTGEYMVIPVWYDLPAGRSADIASLLSATASPINPSQSAKFTPSLVEDYAATWLNMLTVYKTMNDRGAFVEARQREINGLLRQLGNSASHALYRAGDGAVGRIGSGGAGSATVVLATFSDTKFFTIGGLYQVAADSSGVPGSLRDSGDSVTCIAINEDAGSVTFNAVVSTQITGAVANDWFIPIGDLTQKMTGLAGWLPLTTPTSTPFFGVDRSVMPTRLAGHRLDQPTVPAEETIMDLCEIAGDRGVTFDRCFVSPRQFGRCAKRLGAKIEYPGGGGTAQVGFAEIAIHTSAGMVRLTPDSDCPDDRGYLLNMDTWRLKHLLDFPHIVADDGVRALRRPALDQIEIRCRYYGQLVCYQPGQNAVFSCSL